MPRQSRYKMKSEREARCYHIICRVTQRQYWLKQDRLKAMLRQQLWKVSKFCGVEVLGYCWMDNHIHLLVRVPKEQALSDEEMIQRCRFLYGEDSLKAQRIEAILREKGREAEKLQRQLFCRMHDLSQFVKEWKQRFAIWHNRSFRTFGTLWSERFKSLWVQDDAHVLRTVSAYIHMNPVRAGIVSHPAEYPFSLYGECCCRQRPEEAEHAHRAFCALMGNHESVQHANVAFEKYLNKSNSNAGDDTWLKHTELPDKDRKEDPKTYFSMSKGHVIGNKDFLQNWKENTDR